MKVKDLIALLQEQDPGNGRFRCCPEKGGVCGV